ncbi:MAG: hypothetical protein HW416_2480 [Chloroflexi bacterium]|nr:hypothetical protein [Chloroflexota bacterium]
MAFVSLAILLTAACAAPAAKPDAGTTPNTPASPKRILAAIGSDPPTISADFIVAGSGTIPGGDALEELLNAGLSHADGEGRLHPQLAEAVPSIDNGLWQVFPDGRMETRWTLRANAVWHDGTPVTTADLLFSATLSQDRDLPVFRDSTNAYNFVDRIDVPDARTLVVSWTRPFIRADALLPSLRPQHILEASYLADKQSMLLHPYWTEAYVGAGPFQLREWVRGSHLIMQAFDRYPLGRPKVDEIKVKFIQDRNAIIANILAGEVELTMGRNLSLPQAVQLRDQWKDGRIDVGYTNWISAWPQLLNPTPAALLDVRFRRALLHGIDREQMVQTIQYGLVPVAHSFVNPTESVYKQIEPGIVSYDLDPRRATQLLEEVGFTRAGDGFFRDASGERITLQVRTSGDDDTHEAAVYSVADYLKNLGIVTEPFIIPQALRDDREFNSTYPGLRVWRLPNDLWTLDRYTSKNAPVPENRFAGGNRSRYMNADFDRLVERYLVTIPEGERVGVLGQIVRQMTDQVTALGLWYNTETIMIGNRLRNVTNKKTGGANQAWNAHEWDVIS